MSSLRQILAPAVSIESTTEECLLAAENQVQQKHNNGLYVLPNNTTCDALNNACIAEKRSVITAKLDGFMQNATYVDQSTNQLLPASKLKDKREAFHPMRKHIKTATALETWNAKVNDISNLIECLEIQDSLAINMQTVACRDSLSLIHEDFPFDTPVFYKLAKEKLAEFDLQRNSSSSSYSRGTDEDDLKQCCAQIEYFYKTVASRSNDLCVSTRWREICPSLLEFNMARVSSIIEKYSLSNFKHAEDMLSRQGSISTVVSTDLNDLMKLKRQLQLKDSDIIFSSPESVAAEFYDRKMSANDEASHGEAVFEIDNMIVCDITKVARSRLSQDQAVTLLSSIELALGTHQGMRGANYNKDIVDQLTDARNNIRRKANGI